MSDTLTAPIYPVHGFLPTGPQRAGLRFLTADRRYYLIDHNGSLRRTQPDGTPIKRIRQRDRIQFRKRIARLPRAHPHVNALPVTPLSY